MKRTTHLETLALTKYTLVPLPSHNLLQLISLQWTSTFYYFFYFCVRDRYLYHVLRAIYTTISHTDFHISMKKHKNWEKIPTFPLNKNFKNKSKKFNWCITPIFFQFGSFSSFPFSKHDSSAYHDFSACIEILVGFRFAFVVGAELSHSNQATCDWAINFVDGSNAAKRKHWASLK